MSVAVANFFNVALILLEDCMLFILASGFFQRKRSNVYTAISFILTSLLSCAIIFFFGNIVLVKYVLLTALLALWVFFVYNTSLIKSCFPSVFLMTYLTVIDNAVLALVSTIMGKEAQELIGTPESYYLICFFTKTLELFGIVIIRTWLGRHFSNAYLSVFDWLKVSAFPLAILFVSVYLLRIYYLAPSLSYELAICNAILLVLDLVSILILRFLEQQQKAVRDNIILRRNIKTELDNIEAWRKAYDGQRKQTHDFQNQLLVIYGLVKEQAPKEEILAYIKRLQNVELPETMMVKTHRTVVDIILNQKYAIAESREIRLLFQLDDLSAFPLPDDALIIVLSNLIDNAIEACSKIENADERFISLKMKVEQMAAFIYIENPTREPVHIVGNRIVTTKKNPLEHGYGLQNITSVLEQNNAVYLLNYNKDNHVFSFSAQIAIDQ